MHHFPPPILNRKIRFALVGCGRIAQNHFAAIRQHGDHAELVGICDINPTALAEAVKTTGAKAFISLKEMLANCDADIFILMKKPRSIITKLFTKSIDNKIIFNSQNIPSIYVNPKDIGNNYYVF